MPLTKSDVCDQLDALVLKGAPPASLSNRIVRHALGDIGSLETINKYRKAWLAEKHPGAQAAVPAPTKRPVSLTPSDLAKLKMLLAIATELETVVLVSEQKDRERKESSRRS